VELIPKEEHIWIIVHAWWHCRATGRPMIEEKSRRLIMSWVFRGLRLWSMGLRRETGVVCGLTYPKAAEHVWRFWWLHTQLCQRRPEFNLAPCIARDGNVGAFDVGSVRFPNGSMVSTMNQAGQSFQGSGYSWVDMEEFSLYMRPEYMYGQALRVTEGGAESIGGQVTIITNASPNKAWQNVKRLAGELLEKMRGLWFGDCANGALYVRLHYSADKLKDEKWAAKHRAETPDREWRREMELDETIHEGEPVHPDYRDKWHCPNGNSPLPIIKDSVYVGGWDCGTSLSSAFVLDQITPAGQVQRILEVVPPAPEPMTKLAPRVLQAIVKRIPTMWDQVHHWADLTIRTRSGANGMTSQQAAALSNIKLRPGSNEPQGRIGAVDSLLLGTIEDEASGNVYPRFVLDGFHCPVSREGFQGAYKLDPSPSGDEVGPGRVLKDKPLKNSYSHVMEAGQYSAARDLKIIREMEAAEGRAGVQGRNPRRFGAKPEPRKTIAELLGR
jgi:hypothetical protein